MGAIFCRIYGSNLPHKTTTHCRPSRLPATHHPCVIQSSTRPMAVYDRQFRLKASVTSSTYWSTTDLDIWNNAFLAVNITQGFPPSQWQPKAQYGTRRITSNQTRCSPSQQRICLDWNDDPNPDCQHPHCKYKHTCYRCAYNPRITDNDHKTTFCPNKGKNHNANPLSTNQGGRCDRMLTTAAG